MKSVCYILSYYAPDYGRTRSLVKALGKIDSVVLYQCRNTSKGFWRYFQTFSKLILTRIVYNPDIYILGFRGYEHYLPVRLITLGKPLIFDHMMSPYDSLLNERKQLRKNGILAKSVFWYEKLILKASNLILTDTNSHKLYFQELFDIAPDKIFAVPIGTDEELFHPLENGEYGRESNYFEVLFFGSFLPLHGMDVIVKAAALLQDYPIQITLAGGQKSTLPSCLKMIQDYNLNKVRLLEWIEYEHLPRVIASSDLGLGGAFGNTGQSHRVITGKTFQFLAMAKPVVVGKMNDNDNGFENRENCLLVEQGDEQLLADVILWAFNHQSELKAIGLRGFDLYLSRYSVERVAEDLKRILKI